MMKLLDSGAVGTRVRRILLPRTKWGRVTLWSGGLSVLLVARRWITGTAPHSLLSGWPGFFALVFAIGALWLSSRWAWR